jgi:Na+-translocating ferredoxin:NAD+ oxidoreductase subunit B
MSEIVLYTIISLTGLGLIAAAILYFVATKFKVFEDPRIDEVEQALPLTNCGGCGHPGCRAFAEACVKADDLSDLHCPVGGNETMQNVASILGMEVEERDKYVAVVRCAGSLEYRQKTSIYEGAPSCAVAASLYGGDTGCSYGCLYLGDCVKSCDFEAMYLDPVTGLPVVIEDKCVACNACVTSCPKDIMELWPQGRKNRKIYVACINEDKGGTAKKACEVACTGCSKCEKECKYDAITIENYLAYIDPEKCKLCRKCVDVCGSHSIHEINFPPRKLKEAVEEGSTRSKREKRSSETTSSDAAVLEAPPTGDIDVVEMAKARRQKTREDREKNKNNESE